jgi:two-component system sensor histidine kinase KdpD
MPSVPLAGPDARTMVRLLVAVAAVVLATLAIAALEGVAQVPNASSVFLVAVVGVAVAWGTLAAVAVAIAAILVYDFLFTDPLHTLTVADPGEWLSLVLLLFVAVTVGRLAALQRGRAEIAVAREREARALFQVSRALATRGSTAAVLPTIATALRDETGMDRVWLSLGPDDAGERVVADTGAGRPPAPSGSVTVLRRAPGDEPATWVRVHGPAARRAGAGGGASGGWGPSTAAFRVRIEAAGQPLGSIWARRARDAGEPDRTATRLLAAAADQVGQAIAQDRLADDARAAEIARQSDALKSALLESVSHDLRTPLASIRAAAGSLMDPEVVLAPDEARANAASIDREAERLNRIVSNLLDLGRIEGGALRTVREVVDLDEAAERAVAAVERRPGDPPIELDVAASLRVEADPVMLEEVLLNVLDNAVGHTPAGTRVRLVASELPDAPFIRVLIDDAGPGVPAEALPRLFDKFYRGPSTGPHARRGTGIGLAVVRGLVEAMGGRVVARPGELGGLAVEIDLPIARLPAGYGVE